MATKYDSAADFLGQFYKGATGRDPKSAAKPAATPAPKKTAPPKARKSTKPVPLPADGTIAGDYSKQRRM